MSDKRFKVIATEKWGKSVSYGYVDTVDMTYETLPAKEFKAFARKNKNDVDGVVFDGRKLVSIEPIDMKEYQGKATIPYSVIEFFNRLCLELSDIPDQVERLVNALKSEKSFAADCGGSHADYANGLASDYEAIRDVFPPKEFYNLYYQIGKSKFSKVFDTFRQHSLNTYRNIEVPEEYFEELCKITGMPLWYKGYMKDRLYSLG